jgi:hypothetical protein
MTFLAPAFFWGALAAATGIVALHFIVTRQPRASILPTARFVPDSAATATSRNATPSDLLLMLLRVIIVLAAGSALAKPIITPHRAASQRVFVVDNSRAVASASEPADSVSRLYRAGDQIVVFDSSARTFVSNGLDSLHAMKTSTARGNISAAVIASVRAASAIRDRADSLELVIVSPFLDEERDAATDSIRKLWRGRARLVHVAARRDSAASAQSQIDIRSASGDGVAIAVSLASKAPTPGTSRIVRSALTSDDSTWAALADHVLVVWPANDRPPFAVVRSPVDQSGAVVIDSASVIAAFTRRWTFPSDSLRGVRIVARWADGEAAVVEKNLGSGCIRSVTIPVANVGDLVIRPEFVALLRGIASGCGGSVSTKPIETAAMSSLIGPTTLAPSGSFAARTDLSSPFAPWLLSIALAAAILELFVRGIARSGKAAQP